MRHYELTLILSPDLSENEGGTFHNKIQSIIQEEDGIITETRNPIKKNLGHPIKNNKEVFLTAIIFNLAAEKLGNLEKKLKAENQILRYLILNKPETKVSFAESKKMSFSSKILPPKTHAEKEIVKPKEKKVELKEIEKKLEEILGE